ncbi:MAG: hypothetical protein JXR95_12130 [Deltaproteobacteria bacterium]|nr:hypothetical protein [Deltaproteobacteria bacterium]
MKNLNSKDSVVELLHLSEILYSNLEHLSPQEKTLLAFLVWHLTGDTRVLLDIPDNSTGHESREFKIISYAENDDVAQLTTLFNEVSFDFGKMDDNEIHLWTQIWLFLFGKPERAELVIEAGDCQDLNQELFFAKLISEKYKEALQLSEGGGIIESRFMMAMLTGDTAENWLEGRKHLNKSDALETLMKIEYTYRAHQNNTPFLASEMTLYGNCGEQDFKDSVMYQYAITGEEEMAIEQLMTLTERTNWAKPLALRSAIHLASSKGEDVILARLYHKMYQTALSDEIKGAAILRAALILEFRLKRFREAEEFYRIAYELKARPHIARRGLLRMLLNRRAFGEIVEMATTTDDDMLKSAAALLAELRIKSYSKAWNLLAPQDIFAKTRLSVILGKWEDLSELYKSPNPYVPQSVMKLISSIYFAGTGLWGEAEKSLSPIENISPIFYNMVLLFWNRERQLLEKAVINGEEVARLAKNPVTRRAVYSLLADWTSDALPAISSKYMGKFLENGGTIPASTDDELIQLLLNHPDPDPEWFKGIEGRIDDYILEYDAGKDWEKLAVLLEIKAKMSEQSLMKTDLYLRLARLYEDALENIEKSAKCYTEVLNINSGNRIALEALGRINETNENWDEYLQVLRLSMEANDDINIKAGLYFKYGSILETQFDKIDEALRYYKLAIDACPTSLPALHGIREIYVRKENWKGVLNTLKMEASIWDDPKEKAGIYTQMGEILINRLERREQAERYFEAALALRPDSPGALRALFSIYFNDENWEKAGEIASSLGPKALTEGTSEERAKLNYKRGLVFLKNDEKHEAAGSFITAIQLDKDNLTPLHALLDLSTDYEDHDEFSIFLDEIEAVYQDFDNPGAMAMIAIAKAKYSQNAGNNLAALDLYREAGSLAPCLIDAVTGETELLLLVGEEEASFTRWKEYSEKCMSQKNPVDMLKMVSFYSEKLDRGRDAMGILRKLLQIYPNDLDCLYELASELFAANQLREAIVTTDRLLTLSTRDKSSSRMKYLALAIQLKSEAGETRKVDELLSQIKFEELSTRDCCIILNTMVKRGDLARAVTSIRKVNPKNDSETSFLALHRGLLAIMAGNTNGALEELESISSESTTARKVLADMAIASNDTATAMKYLEQLLDSMWDDPAFLEVMSRVIPERTNRSKRISQVRSVLDSGSVTGVFPHPLLKSGVMSSDEFRRKIGIKDPTGHEAQMWFAIKTGIELIFKPLDPALSEARLARGPELLGWEEVEATLGAEGKLWVADLKTRPVLVIVENNEYQVVVKPEIFDFPISTIRYILARALESARSGYSMFFQMTSTQRAEIRNLMYGLGMPPEERDDTVKKFLESLGRQEQKAVERVSASSVDIFQTLDLKKWMSNVELSLDRVGLLLSGDIASVFQGNSWLSSKHTATSDNLLTNFATAPRTEDITKEFLSSRWDTYYGN